MTDEQRKKAWAAAQAIYEALESKEGASEILGSAIREVAHPTYFGAENIQILKEIGSHLYTLHDEDFK